MFEIKRPAEIHIWTGPCKVMLYDYERRLQLYYYAYGVAHLLSILSRCLLLVPEQLPRTHLYIFCQVVLGAEFIYGASAFACYAIEGLTH